MKHTFFIWLTLVGRLVWADGSVPVMKAYTPPVAGGTMQLNGVPGSVETGAKPAPPPSPGPSTLDTISDTIAPVGVAPGHSGGGEVFTQVEKKVDAMVDTLTTGSNRKKKALIQRVFGDDVKLSAKNGSLDRWKKKLLDACGKAKKYVKGAASAINFVGPAATVAGHLSVGDTSGAGYAVLNEGGKKVAVWGGTSAGTAAGGPVGAVIGATLAEEGYNRTGGVYVDGLAQDSATHATMISQYGKENYDRYLPIFKTKEEIFGQTGKTWQEKNREWRTVFEKMKADLAAQRENARNAAQTSRETAQTGRTTGGSSACRPTRVSTPRPARPRCDGRGSCRK